jgi:protein subunit release factor B
MPLIVTPRKEERLRVRMAELGLREEDLVEKFVRGSGPGGQKINKTSSCVYLLHRPTGTEIKCQQERSQALNRFLARVELCDRVEDKVRGERSRRRQEAEKIRRQKRKRSRRAKQRMLESKRRQGDKKKLRGRVRGGEE